MAHDHLHRSHQPSVSHTWQSPPSWQGPPSSRPALSWQIYSTVELPDTPIDIAQYLGGLELVEYGASFEIYSPQPIPLACIEHQHRERAHRKTVVTSNPLNPDSDLPGRIPETYKADQLYVGGFLIVIDDPNWKNDFHGPLFVYFDIRPQHLRVVEPGLNAEDAGIYEQIEMELDRQDQPHQISRWLKSKGNREDWEELWNETREKFSASAPTLSRPLTEGTQLQNNTNIEMVVEALPIEDGVFGMRVTSGQAEGKRNLVYDFYAMFQPSLESDLSLESLARRFTGALLSHLPSPSPSFAFTFYGFLPNITSIISHRQLIGTATPGEVGYLTPDNERRIYPHYGLEAAGAVYLEEMEYRNFLVVIDKENWEDQGVCFLWEGRKEQEMNLYRVRAEDEMGRGEGLEWLAGRLSGRL